MAKRITLALSGLSLLVVALLVAFGHVSTPRVGADYPVPQGPAGSCDASVGAGRVCGSFPASLELANGPAGKVKVLEWAGDAYAFVDGGGSGGSGSLDGAVVSVTGTSPITTTDDAGHVNVAIGRIAIDAGTVGELPLARVTACDGGLVPTGLDGGSGWKCEEPGVTNVTGSTPLVCMNSSGVVSCSVSAATSGAEGVVQLAGDLSPCSGSTASAPGICTLRNGVWNVSSGGPGLVGAYQSNGAFITQNAPTSDLAAQTFSVAAMPAFAGATVNLTGGELDLIGGAGATTNGTGGNVIAKVSAPSGSGTEAYFGVERGTANYFAVGALTGFAGAYTALWFNPGIAPTTTNYQLNTNGTDLSLNGSPIYLVGGGLYNSFAGTGIQFGSSTLDFGSGSGVIGISKAATAPASAPSTSGDAVVWSDTGGLKDWQNTGLLTTIVPSASGTLGTQYRSAPAYVGYVTSVGSAGTATLTIPIPTQATYGVTCSLNASVTARTKTAGATGALGDSAFREIANAFWESSGGTITKIAASDVSLLSTTVSSTSLASASFASSVSGSNVVLTYTNPTIVGISVDATLTADLTCN